jgi:hypothetical protein
MPLAASPLTVELQPRLSEAVTRDHGFCFSWDLPVFFPPAVSGIARIISETDSSCRVLIDLG